ncbi:MAG: helix-turn-helix domain-containing protein [Micropepsaceae bacterium]
MTKPYKSKVLAAIHETAGDLYNSRLISRRSMKAFDTLCLTPVKPLSPKQIRTLRLRENASQAVFARYLNVTTGLISQWERGEKAPRGASLKLLTLVQNKGLASVE